MHVRLALMDRFLKHLLLWFLMAALPVQGMTAIIKANCGPRHHTSFSENMFHGVQQGHEHVHGQAPQQGHTDTQAALEIGETDNTTVETFIDTPSEPSGTFTSYCSACAACYTGSVAPPVTVSTISVPDSVGEVVVYPPFSYLGFIPAGLDRPPKSFSA